MLKRYDPTTDEFVELTQEYFDKLNKQFYDLMKDYNKNSPENYKKFWDNYILTGNTENSNA